MWWIYPEHTRVLALETVLCGGRIIRLYGTSLIFIDFFEMHTCLHIQIYIHTYIIYFIYIYGFIYLFPERGEGRETSMCSWCLSYWGPDLQPRPVPWLGIDPATLWFGGRHSGRHWATPARAVWYTFWTPLFMSTGVRNMVMTVSQGRGEEIGSVILAFRQRECNHVCVRVMMQCNWPR